MAGIELETIPEEERRRQGTPLAAGVDASERVLPAQAVETLGAPAEDPASCALDIVTEARRDLVAYRVRVDSAVRAEHGTLAAWHHREARWWMALAVTVLLLPAAGLPSAAACGVWAWFCFPLAHRRGWSPSRLRLALILPAAVLVAGRLTLDPLRELDAVAAVLLAAGVAVVPTLHAWLVAPLPDPALAVGAAATGDLGHDAPDLDPSALARIHRSRQATMALNHEAHRLSLRLSTARCAAGGAVIGGLGLLVAGLGGQFGALSLGGIVIQAVVGAVLGGWIGQKRPSLVRGLVVSGLVLIWTHMLLLVTGQAGLQVLTAFWVWSGWGVAGGTLALAMEVEGNAVPQRTS